MEHRVDQTRHNCHVRPVGALPNGHNELSQNLKRHRTLDNVHEELPQMVTDARITFSSTIHQSPESVKGRYRG